MRFPQFIVNNLSVQGGRMWDSWSSFVAKNEMYIRDGLHLSGKGAGVLDDGLKRGWTEGIGKASSKWTRAVY